MGTFANIASMLQTTSTRLQKLTLLNDNLIRDGEATTILNAELCSVSGIVYPSGSSRFNWNHQ
eukprot:scaffold324778_cov149-Cyclotella_meneghiniana.AAC.2